MSGNNFHLGSNLASFCMTYFDFLYYFLLCPYHFSITSEKHQQIQVHRNTYQRLAFILLNILACLHQTAILRWSLGGLQTAIIRDAGFYFEKMTIVTSLISVATFQLSIWRNGNKFLSLVQALVTHSKDFILTPANLSKWQCRKVSRLFFVIVTCCIIFEFMRHFFLRPNSGLLQIQEAIQLARNSGRNIFYLENYQNSSQLCFNQMSLQDIMFTFLGIITFLYHTAATYFSATGLLVSALCIWPASARFKKMLTIDRTTLFGRKSIDWSQVLQRYENLKEISRLISEAFGSMLTSMLVNMIISQARYLDLFLFEIEWFKGTLMVFILIGSVMALVLAAETVVNVLAEK